VVLQQLEHVVVCGHKCILRRIFQSGRLRGFRANPLIQVHLFRGTGLQKPLHGLTRGFLEHENTHAYTHTHTHTHIHTHTRTYTRTYTHTHTYNRERDNCGGEQYSDTSTRGVPEHLRESTPSTIAITTTHTHTHTHTHTYTHTRAFTHIHTYTFTHTNKHTHVHSHNHKHTSTYRMLSRCGLGISRVEGSGCHMKCIELTAEGMPKVCLELATHRKVVKHRGQVSADRERTSASRRTHGGVRLRSTHCGLPAKLPRNNEWLYRKRGIALRALLLCFASLTLTKLLTLEPSQ
jgi:hypothetical protein